MSRKLAEFERFADELARLRGRMRVLFEKTRAEAGLTEMEMTVLTATANASSPPTVARIGRSLGHPRQVVQRAANRLVELGLVEFCPNPDHKTSVLLEPTTAGREVKRADHDRAQAVVDKLMARIGAPAIVEAADQLHKIRSEIESFVRSKT